MAQSIGERVLALIPPREQGKLADAIGMTPDALSRALRGQRGFGAGELARIADHYGADLHELITGEPDPNRVRMMARHSYDALTRQRSIPDRERDTALLEDIKLAYIQAATVDLPARADVHSVGAVLELLGQYPVRRLIEHVESDLGIGVVRIPGLSTSYSFCVGGSSVIALRAEGNWFYENWSIAHELGHLVLGHHDVDDDAHEATANAFAAEFLLPERLIRSVDWTRISSGDLAWFVWDRGVSTKALAKRLRALRVDAPQVIQALESQTTQRLLRTHGGESVYDVTRRMTDAAERRFPEFLREAHVDLISRGRIGRGTLAWMLDVPAESLADLDEPKQTEMSTDDLVAALDI